MEKGLEGDTHNVTVFIFFFSLLDRFTKSKYEFQDKKKDDRGTINLGVSIHVCYGKRKGKSEVTQSNC